MIFWEPELHLNLALTATNLMSGLSLFLAPLIRSSPSFMLFPIPLLTQRAHCIEKFGQEDKFVYLLNT